MKRGATRSPKNKNHLRRKAVFYDAQYHNIMWAWGIGILTSSAAQEVKQNLISTVGGEVTIPEPSISCER